jgi:hypothetical protein
VGGIANYCNWLGWPLFLLQVVTGTEADTLSQTEEAVPGDEGHVEKVVKAKKVILMSYLLIYSFIHPFILGLFNNTSSW